MFTTAAVRIDNEDGYINIAKRSVFPGSRQLLVMLRDYVYQATCIRAPEATLLAHDGHLVQKRINQLSFCCMGIVNWGPNQLIKYESAKCFSDFKFNFVNTHFMRICDCQDKCDMQEMMLIIFGIVLDIVKYLRSNFNARITLEAVFSRRNTLDFISRYTTRVGLDRFKIIDSVPRSYKFDNTRTKWSVTVFEDDILHKDEALKPKVFKPKFSPATSS